MKKLVFTSDTFTILQAADIQDAAILSLAMRRLLKTAVRFASPDLVILTGDNIPGYACKKNVLAKIALKGVMNVLKKTGVPVAAVFGNHDDQDTPFNKDRQMALYETYPNFVGERGLVASMTVNGNTLTNVGTYLLKLYDKPGDPAPAAALWCFDSGTYNPDEKEGGYGLVFKEQVDWYVEESRRLEEEKGEKVPGYVFQHIAPPQIFDALKEVPEGTPGAVRENGKWYVLPDAAGKDDRLREAPCPPHIADREGFRQLDAMIERKDILAVFFGHDHINAYVVPYKGVDLVNSPGCTFYSYNDEMRGFRIIRISRADPKQWTSKTVTAVELFKNDPAGKALLKIHDGMKAAEKGFDRLKDSLRKRKR